MKTVFFVQTDEKANAKWQEIDRIQWKKMFLKSCRKLKYYYLV